MDVLSIGSLNDIVRSANEESETDGTLPGLALVTYTVHRIPEINRWSSAEVYMFGVAADASGSIVAIPFGQDKLDERQDLFQMESVKEEQAVSYLGEGLPLILPPLNGFLAIRLLLADSDSSARDAVEVIKSVADTVSTKESIALLTATGAPHVAAAAVVLGKTLETATKVMDKNRDDVVETFEGYFKASQMVAGEMFEAKNANASATFRFIDSSTATQG